MLKNLYKLKINKSLLGSMLLLITAFIWGSAFVAQSVGMNYIKPLTFNSIRCFMAGIFLLPIYKIYDINNAKTKKDINSKEDIMSGIICGIVLFAASTIQQYGISMTSVSKAGFISVLYILFVPIIQIVKHNPLPKLIWPALIIALLGMYFLCFTGDEESFFLQKGDFIVLISAFFYALHILVIDKYAPTCNSLKLSCYQFLTAGTIGLILTLLFDKPSINDILAAWLPISYAGILSGGVAYTLQVIAQKWTPASIASIIMSLESTFAVISSIIILKEIPSIRELIGCILMFISITIIQSKKNSK